MRDVRLPDFPFALPLEVRFRDLDAMGHVNNAVYLTYFEEARSRYWFALRGAHDYRDLGFIVVHAECDYASPATLLEPLLVGCRVVEIRRTSFVFEYRIVSGELSSGSEARLVASGRTVQALYDWSARKTVAVGEELRKQVEAFEGRPVKGGSR